MSRPCNPRILKQCTGSSTDVETLRQMLVETVKRAVREFGGISFYAIQWHIINIQ